MIEKSEISLKPSSENGLKGKSLFRLSKISILRFIKFNYNR